MGRGGPAFGNCEGVNCATSGAVETADIAGRGFGGGGCSCVAGGGDGVDGGNCVAVGGGGAKGTDVGILLTMLWYFSEYPGIL